MQRVVLRAAAMVAALVCTPVAGAWTWPAGGPVLQPFVFDPVTPYAGGQHRGIDVGADVGAPVLAPVGGTISFAGSVPNSGKSVTIQTPDGLSVTLTHLGTLGAIRNAVVAEGSAVGTAGASGTPEVAEPYVHLGVRITAQDQGYVDPVAFLPARVSVPPPVPEPLAPEPAPVAAVPAAPAPAEPAPSPLAEQTASPATADPVPSTPEAATDPTFLQPVDDGLHPEPAPKDVDADPKATAESAHSAGDALASSAASSTGTTQATTASAETTAQSATDVPGAAADLTLQPPVDEATPEATPGGEVDPSATGESTQGAGAPEPETATAVAKPVAAPSSAAPAGEGGDVDSPEPVTTATTSAPELIPATPESASPTAPADASAEPPASTAEPVTPSGSETPTTAPPPGPTTSAAGSGGNLESPDVVPVSSSRRPHSRNRRR